MTIKDDKNLGPEGWKAIGGSLSALKQLSLLKLKIGHKNIEPEGGKAIGDAL